MIALDVAGGLVGARLRLLLAAFMLFEARVRACAPEIVGCRFVVLRAGGAGGGEEPDWIGLKHVLIVLARQDGGLHSPHGVCEPGANAGWALRLDALLGRLGEFLRMKRCFGLRVALRGRTAVEGRGIGEGSGEEGGGHDAVDCLHTKRLPLPRYG